MGMASDQRYAEWPARLSPRSSVACLWASRPTEASAGCVLPDACIDIIWDGASLFVAGPDSGPVPIIPRAGQFFAGLRFLPGRAPGFLGVPASELLDSRVPLADLWGKAPGDCLADRLASAASPAAAASVLDQAVADRAKEAPAPDPLIDELVALYTTTQPDASRVVQIASRAMSVGERRLHRHCCAAVGYGPKMLERVLRFQRARRIARGTTSLALLAALAGYADQAHLTRESRRLAGTTPSDLFKTTRRAAS
jgi:AraC-like DNA-binding protein